MSPIVRERLWQNVCPRCGQACHVQPTTGRLLSHRDPAVNAPCPIRGKTVREAVEIVNAERARLGLALLGGHVPVVK